MTRPVELAAAGLRWHTVRGPTTSVRAPATRAPEATGPLRPAEPLETEVDPTKTRHKRDPGRCFRRAGWTVTGERRGLVILRAPRGEP